MEHFRKIEVDSRVWVTSGRYKSESGLVQKSTISMATVKLDSTGKIVEISLALLAEFIQD